MGPQKLKDCSWGDRGIVKTGWLTECRGWQELIKVVILGTNGVVVKRYGLILNEDGATGSRKVFRCLLGLRDAI